MHQYIEIGTSKSTQHSILVWVPSNDLQMMRITWATSPIALIIAQKFLAPEAWVPFFNLIAFVFGTCKDFRPWLR